MSNGSSTSDTQNALNDVSASNGTAIDSVSTIIGTITDALSPLKKFADAVVGIIGLVNALENFGKPDPLLSELERVNSAIQNAFQQLNANDAANTLLTRNGTIHQDLVPALKSLDELKASVNDPTRYPPGPLIMDCVNTLEYFSFNDDFVWNTSYSSQDFEKIYWTDIGLYQGTCIYGAVGGGYAHDTADVGYHKQSPPLNPDGVTVFEYRYSLPLYLYTVSIFLSVGGALDPNFVANQSDPLRRATEVLQSKYDKIKSGLTALSPPNWTDLGFIQTACPGPYGDRPPSGLRAIWMKDSGPPVGAIIEYGAVEKFSGYSSIGDKYQINFRSNSDYWDPAQFAKLQLRLLKRIKDVYVNVGLSRVRHVINQLNALLGQPQLGSPTFKLQDGSLVNLEDWSFRQIVGLSKLTPSAGRYSLRALANFIIRTQPFDTPYTNAPSGATVSCRTLLAGFSD